MMYLITAPLFLIILPAISTRVPSILAPFNEPYLPDSQLLINFKVNQSEIELKKRDGNCPNNYDSCSILAAEYGGACCAQGSSCTTDGAHQIACCSKGAKCTGILDRLHSPTLEGNIGSSAITTGSPTFNPDPTIPAPTITGSTVNNIYFPFPYSPTSYPDEMACFSALNSCQANYVACLENLQGTSYGVTIIAPAGGITVSPTAQILGASSATKICSSLSSQACHEVASSDCTQFQTSTSAPTVANVVVRPTVDWLAIAGIVAGMVLEIVYQLCLI